MQLHSHTENKNTSSYKTGGFLNWQINTTFFPQNRSCNCSGLKKIQNLVSKWCNIHDYKTVQKKWNKYGMEYFRKAKKKVSTNIKVTDHRVFFKCL